MVWYITPETFHTLAAMGGGGELWQNQWKLCKQYLQLYRLHHHCKYHGAQHQNCDRWTIHVCPTRCRSRPIFSTAFLCRSSRWSIAEISQRPLSLQMYNSFNSTCKRSRNVHKQLAAHKRGCVKRPIAGHPPWSRQVVSDVYPPTSLLWQQFYISWKYEHYHDSADGPTVFTLKIPEVRA